MNGRGRRGWAALLIAAALVAGCRGPDDLQGAARGASLLVVTLDTVRQDVLGPYGGPASTPTLEALAADGILLHGAYSNAFGTTPSHASLWTASPAARHGIYDNKTVLAAEPTTLAEVLHAAGYATAAFVGAVPLDRSLGLDQGFEVYDDQRGPQPGDELGRFAHAERRADTTVDRFLAWLDEAPAEPFFAWLHFYDPHQPYAPRGFAAPAGSLFTTPSGAPRYVRVDDELAGRLAAEPGLREALESEGRRRYLAEIEFVDRQLGRALDALHERRLYDDTLVMVTADHGENFAEQSLRFLFTHVSLFDEVSRLPLIVKLPHSELRGEERRFLLGSVDLAPTLLELLGLPPPAGWTGRSFAPWLATARRGFRRLVVLEGAHQHEIAVRTEGWLYREIVEAHRGDGDDDHLSYLAYRPATVAELYRVGPDGVAHFAEEPERQRALAEAVRRFLELKERGGGRTLDDPEHLEALRTLGYLD